MIRLAFAFALAVATNAPLSAQEGEVEDDGDYTTQLSVGLGRFTGDYGEDEDTTLDVVSFNARRYFTRGEIHLSVPYLSVDGGGVRLVDDRPIAVPDDQVTGRQRESGVGDIVVRGEYYVRTGSRTSPWVIGLLRVKLPTGNDERGLGTGATDVEAGIGWIQRRGRINWLADVGYNFVGGAADLDPKNVLRLGGGVSVPFGVDERSNAYVYFENRTSRFEGSDDNRSLAVGVGTSFDEARRVRFSAAAFFGFTDTAEDWGVYLTLGHRR